MFKYIALTATLALLISFDVAADNAQLAGEATTIITDVMRAIFKVITEFVGDILDEFVRALKEFF